jgi:hypothetical protein
VLAGMSLSNSPTVICQKYYIIGFRTLVVSGLRSFMQLVSDQ